MNPLVVLAAASAILAAGTAPAAERETVAVMDFGVSGASASEAAALSDFVRQAVVASGVFTVVDKKNMERVLGEQAFQQTGCTDQDCAVKLGRILNVRKMIVGSYTLLGGVRFMSAQMVRVETGEIEKTARVKGFQIADADQAADQLVAILVGRAAAPAAAYDAPQPAASTPPLPAGSAAPAYEVPIPMPPGKERKYPYFGVEGGILAQQEEHRVTWYRENGVVQTFLDVEERDYWMGRLFVWWRNVGLHVQTDIDINTEEVGIVVGGNLHMDWKVLRPFIMVEGGTPGVAIEIGTRLHLFDFLFVSGQTGANLKYGRLTITLSAGVVF